MELTKIEDYGKNKIKIFIDDEYKFWLYKKEISKYSYIEEEQISTGQYNELHALNLLRAKKQVLNLLKRMDKTRQEVIRKLKQAAYNDEIIEQTLGYIDTYNYIDDEKYARQYIRYKRDNKSKREITNVLMIKGVAKDIIERALDQEYETEEVAIIKAINKKRLGKEELSENSKEKLRTTLYNRGFSFDLIKKHLNT